MNFALVARHLLAASEHAILDRGIRLASLSNSRGPVKYHISVHTMFETGIVGAIHEQLLSFHPLREYIIANEKGYPSDLGGAPKSVDLWLRRATGGRPNAVEVGDFRPRKIHRDLGRLKHLNSRGTNWFLALFRKGPGASSPWQYLERSFGRANGLKKKLVESDERLCRSIAVPTGAATAMPFGIALLRAKKATASE